MVKNIVFRHVGCNLKGLATIDGSAMVMVGGVDGVGGMEEMQEFVAAAMEKRPIQTRRETRQKFRENKEKSQKKKGKPLPDLIEAERNK